MPSHHVPYLVLWCFHAKVSTGMLNKHVVLSEGALVQEDFDTFPGRQLTLFQAPRELATLALDSILLSCAVSLFSSLHRLSKPSLSSPPGWKLL